jgi:hypothetical protein
MELLRQETEVVVLSRTNIAIAASLELQVALPQPGVSLLHVCYPPTTRAHQSRMLPQLKILPLKLVNVGTAYAGVVIRWNATTPAQGKCVGTYEVLYARSSSGQYSHLEGQYASGTTTSRPMLFNAYVHQNALAAKAGGVCYKVRAVDYWGVVGASSAPQCL